LATIAALELDTPLSHREEKPPELCAVEAPDRAVFLHAPVDNANAWYETFFHAPRDGRPRDAKTLSDVVVSEP